MEFIRIETVTKDATYKATFTVATKSFTVKFYDESGVNYTPITVSYGMEAVYPNATPTKTPTKQYSYIFYGWVTEVGGEIIANLSSVYSDMSVYAKFTETERQYAITWLNYDNTPLLVSTFKYDEMPKYEGDAPAKPADEQFSYTFSGWSPEIVKVTEDTSYKAQ